MSLSQCVCVCVCACACVCVRERARESGRERKRERQRERDTETKILNKHITIDFSNQSVRVSISSKQLTFTTLLANSADNKLMIYIFFRT